MPRLRLSSLEPWDLDADFFSLWEDARFVSICICRFKADAMQLLSEWRARPRPLLSANLVTAARQIMPEAAITTDIIAGFPGETEDEFAESLAFVKEMNFAGGHAFTLFAAARDGSRSNERPSPP